MGKRHVQTVHTQKGNTNGPHTYKKMVSLTDSEKKKSLNPFLLIKLVTL